MEIDGNIHCMNCGQLTIDGLDVYVITTWINFSMEEYFRWQEDVKKVDERDVIFCNYCKTFHKEDAIFEGVCGCKYKHINGETVRVAGCNMGNLNLDASWDSIQLYNMTH